MRIMGINAGTSPRFAPLMQERMWIVMRNNFTATCPIGGCVVFDTGGTTYVDSGGTTRLFGYDFDRPETLTFPVCVGSADAAILTTEFGEIQTYGYDDDTATTGLTGSAALDHAVPVDDSFVRVNTTAVAAAGDGCVLVGSLPANGVSGNAEVLLGYMGAATSSA